MANYKRKKRNYRKYAKPSRKRRQKQSMIFGIPTTFLLIGGGLLWYFKKK
jgi:hypothetical protein